MLGWEICWVILLKRCVGGGGGGGGGEVKFNISCFSILCCIVCICCRYVTSESRARAVLCRYQLNLPTL